MGRHLVAGLDVRVDANARIIRAHFDQCSITPGLGAKPLDGSSALMRHSIACPANDVTLA